MSRFAKKKGLRSIRNILLVLFSMVVALFSADRLLKVDYPETYYDSEMDYSLQENENSNIELLQIEQMDKLDFLSAIYPTSDIYKAMLSTLTDEEKTVFNREKNERYPLISHMQQDDIYDENTVNILVLGDSFTWGEASINRNEIYWRLVENDLRRKGYNVKVTAVAMINANSFDEIRWLTKTSLMDDVKPDIVIFGYLYNDPEFSMDYAYIDDYDMFPDILRLIQPKYSSFFNLLGKYLPNLSLRLKNYILARTLYTEEGNAYIDFDVYPIWASPILKDNVLQLFEENFMAPLNEFAGQQDIPVILMPLAVHRGETMLKQLYKPLHELCKTYRNIQLYDSTNDFFHGFASSEHTQNYIINFANPHPGSALNYFYAQFMEKFLIDDYSDVIGKPSDNGVRSRGLSVNEALPYGALKSVSEKTEDHVVCELHYPAVNEKRKMGELTIKDYLTIPLKKSFIAISFAEPVDLERIEIISENTSNIEIYYRSINEKLNYDDHSVLPFGEKNGNVWYDTSADRVTTLLIHADGITGMGADMIMTVDAV